MIKRVLIVSGIFLPDIGGPATYARTLATHLNKNGTHASVLTYSSVRHHASDTSLGFPVHRVWVRWPWGIRHTLFFLKTLWYLHRSDVVLALNAATAGLPAATAARVLGKPLVVRVVGDYAWEMAIQSGDTFLLINDFQKQPRHGRARRLHRMQVWTCRRARMIIVPSEYLARLVAGWGIDPKSITVIANSVTTPKISQSKEEARRTLGIQGNVIVSAGRLVPWKGFRMLIKLMPALQQVNQFFRLVVIGDGPDMAMLRSVVRTLGLERKVTLTGRVDAQHVVLWLAAADMFVLNTGYEGFSHQVLEAMAAGVPVITTSVGGNREVVVQGSNGFMVPYNDEFNLLEAMKAVWKNQELREKMIENGRATAAAFTPEKMYERTLAVLQEVSS